MTWLRRAAAGVCVLFLAAGAGGGADGGGHWRYRRHRDGQYQGVLPGVTVTVSGAR